MTITRQQVKDYLEVIRLVADHIKEVKKVPSGYLYAALMPAGMTLDRYNRILDTLARARVIKVENHLITWIAD